MAALKYWDGTQWQTLASAVQDTLEWIDLAIPSNYTLPVAPANSQMPFTTVKGSSGLTVNGSGQIVVAKAGVYHVTTSVTPILTTGYTVVTLRQIRAGTAISQREQVPYNSAAWDSATVVGTFDAQVGDLFDVIVSAQVAGTVIETVRAQFQAHRLSGPGTVQALNAASVALNFDTGAGGWTAAVPGPTDGVAFTTPAGVLRGSCTATAYASSAGTNVIIEVYLDGVLLGTMRLAQSVVPNAHMMLSPFVLSRTVTAGTHYLAYRLTSGNSGNIDYGTFNGIVTSATGSVSDVITVLNLRKDIAQAISAQTWTPITGWAVQHAYPAWSLENAGAFLIPADGYYQITAEMQYSALSGGRTIAVEINGAIQGNGLFPPDANYSSGATFSWEGNLRLGDSVKFLAYGHVAGNVVATQAPSNGTTRAVIRKVIAGGVPANANVDTPWADMPMVNGWGNYGAPWETGMYRRVGGVVYMRGLIRTGGAQATQAVIFNLPVGFRPNSDQHIGANSNGGFVTLNIYANGNVCVNTALGAGVWLSMRLPAFPADQ